MHPFLPPHRHYEFGPVVTPLPLQSEDVIEDLPVLQPSPPVAFSALPAWHSTSRRSEQGDRNSIGLSQKYSKADKKRAVLGAAAAWLQRHELQKQAKENAGDLWKENIHDSNATQRQVSLTRKRQQSCGRDNDSGSNKHQKEERCGEEGAKGVSAAEAEAAEATTATTTAAFVTMDRFSACIPCRRRKIKCIPRGDSHKYNQVGSNDGVCATCIRRKKECFWPQAAPSVAIAGTLAATPAAPLTKSAVSSSGMASATKEIKQEVQQVSMTHGTVIEQDTCVRLAKVKGEGVKRETLVVPTASRNTITIVVDAEMTMEDTPLSSPAVRESYFELPSRAFGRIASTLSLSSSSSSSSSSSLPVSPRTEGGFLSPTSFQYDHGTMSFHTLLTSQFFPSACCDDVALADELYEC